MGVMLEASIASCIVQYSPMALSPMAHDDWTIVSIRSGVVSFKPGPLFQPLGDLSKAFLLRSSVAITLREIP